MTTVAILGCGLIGSSWAQAFADSGAEVRLWDPNPGVTKALEQKDSRIKAFAGADLAVDSAEFVQESGPEDLAVKRKLYIDIAARLAPETIVASSTSTLQPTLLQAELPFAERFIVGHPFNPPHILPLVEVVGGNRTAPWAIDKSMSIYRDIGKHPIRLHAERLGHLANRLQAALWREAVDAVASGQASVEDVDAAVMLALGPRWAIMGPFATFHLGGGKGGISHFIEHLGRPFEALWDDAQRPAVTDELKQQLIKGVMNAYGRSSMEDLVTERDERLKSVLAISKRTGFP